MLFKKINAQKSVDKKKKIDKLTAEISEIWSGDNKVPPTDVDGSYTGNPINSDIPEQDADDL